MANCVHCNDSGKLPGSIDLDCSCPAATARVDLKDAVEEFSLHYDRDRQFYPDDRDWFIHQRARQIERQEQAARIADLERALRSAHHLLANVEGMSKNNIENMAGEEADAIAAVLAAAPSAPAVEHQLVALNDPWVIAVRKAEHYCPSELSTTDRWRWKAQFLRNELAAPQAADADKVREALPGWERGIATVTMNGHQLREALNFINPDGPGDELQCEDELTFGIVQHKDDDGKVSTGLCCWNDDTEGVYPLDGDPDPAASMAAQAPVREVPEGDGLTGKWCYSSDGEEFKGPCDTEQEAHAEAQEYAEDGEHYWIGQIKHPADCIGSNRSIGDDIITRADEAAYDECGGDDRAFEFSKEQCERLGAMVREFIRREGSVNRWAVIDSKQHVAPAAPVQQEADHA